MLSASLDGTGFVGRMDTCVYMAESLRCSPEMTTTLLINYTPIQNKKHKVWKKKKSLVQCEPSRTILYNYGCFQNVICNCFSFGWGNRSREFIECTQQKACCRNQPVDTKRGWRYTVYSLISSWWACSEKFKKQIKWRSSVGQVTHPN